MMITALPLIDLVYRRGRFHFYDSQATAIYFFWFSISLAFWAAQALYARAFYAAGNTLTPMIASSIVTLASLPMYAALYRSFSTVGLAMASDLGIIANTLALAILLHYRKLVPLNELPWNELGKVGISAVVAGVVGYRVARLVTPGDRIADLETIGLATVTWGATAALGLWLTRSQLAQELRRRKGTTYPRVAEKQAERQPRN